MGNLPPKFGHAGPLGSRIIRYVRDGRTDGRTDKSNAYCRLSYGREHNKRTTKYDLLRLLFTEEKYLSDQIKKKTTGIGEWSLLTTM